MDLPWPDDAVEVGRVMDAWGLQGWIKVQPFTSDPQALFSSRRWFLKPPLLRGVFKTTAATGLVPSLLRISAVREQAGFVVAQIQGVENRTNAEALRGARIFVSRASFPTAGDDEYYWIDLIGLEVVNRKGEALGRVLGLLDTGPHSVLRLMPPAQGAVDASEERLIPFVAAYVDQVCLVERTIRVDWELDY